MTTLNNDELPDNISIHLNSSGEYVAVEGGRVAYINDEPVKMAYMYEEAVANYLNKVTRKAR